MKLIKRRSVACALASIAALTMAASQPAQAQWANLTPNSPQGNTYGNCAVAVMFGTYGGYPYAQIMDYGSGAGCNTIKATITYFPAGGGNAKTVTIGLVSGPTDYSWKQALAPETGTVFSAEFLQESDNGCWYSASFSSTGFRFTHSWASGCAQT